MIYVVNFFKKMKKKAAFASKKKKQKKIQGQKIPANLGQIKTAVIFLIQTRAKLFQKIAEEIKNSGRNISVNFEWIESNNDIISSTEIKKPSIDVGAEIESSKFAEIKVPWVFF